MWFLYTAGQLLAQATGAPTPVQTEVPVNSLPVQVPHAAASHAQTGFQYVLLFIYFVICAALIALVLLQTSKSEGLSGTLGGSTQSMFQGKKSFEDKLGLITTYIASAFIICSLLVAFFAF